MLHECANRTLQVYYGRQSQYLFIAFNFCLGNCVRNGVSNAGTRTHTHEIYFLIVRYYSGVLLFFCSFFITHNNKYKLNWMCSIVRRWRLLPANSNMIDSSQWMKTIFSLSSVISRVHAHTIHNSLNCVQAIRMGPTVCHLSLFCCFFYCTSKWHICARNVFPTSSINYAICLHLIFGRNQEKKIINQII